MSKNLNNDCFKNGDSIPEAKTNQEWESAGKQGKPAWCYYNNDTANRKCGKLYNWFAVNDPRGLAPEGWHIPDEIEWNKLIVFLGGKYLAGTKMKSNIGWANTDGINGNGNNESGFNAYPLGERNVAIPNFTTNDYEESNWWSNSITGNNDGSAIYLSLWVAGEVETIKNASKLNGFYVRCVKN